MAYSAGMAEELTREQAAAELARADLVAGRVHGRSRWMANYLAVFGAGFGVVTLVLGMVEPYPLKMTIFAVFWTSLVVGMVGWARSRPAAPRGRWRGVWAWVGTGVLYPAALLIGLPGQAGRPAFWVPAAVLVAAPMAAAAWREHRR